MRLYNVIDPEPDFYKVYVVTVLAQDEEHAERAARRSQWYTPDRINKKLLVREVEEPGEYVFCSDLWYGEDNCPEKYRDIYQELKDK